MSFLIVAIWSSLILIIILLITLIFLLFIGKYTVFFIILISFIILLILLAIKFKINLKPTSAVLQEMQHRNSKLRQKEIEFDMEDIIDNKELKKEILSKGYPKTDTKLSYNIDDINTSNIKTHEPGPVNKCQKCEHVILGNHKFCQSCGSKI